MCKQYYRVFGAAIALAATVTACGGQPVSLLATAPAAAPTSAVVKATAAPSATRIAQPATSAPAPTAAATVAPTAADQSSTAGPRFAQHTQITNPLYPVSLIGKTIALGQEGGKPARNEVTLLPDTKMITWNGQQIEARVLQFVAYTDNKLVEIAYDYFAQDTDGGVYYVGEDVSNYEDGKVVATDGSWLAGKDGAPVALIMPAHPVVGQKFNPENLPGVVFESDEVLSLTKSAITPAGPTAQGVLIKETLMDGSIEHKVYAADFGIVEEQADDEQLNLVLFSRADAKPGSVPEPLSTIEAQAEDIIDSVPGDSWGKVTADVAAIAKAWQAYQPQVANDHVPQPFQSALQATLTHMQETAAAKDAAGTMQAANDLSAAVVDLFTVYHPTLPTDVGWLDVLERQVVLDAAAKDVTAAGDSLAKLNAVWTRLKPVILLHNDADVAMQFEKV